MTGMNPGKHGVFDFIGMGEDEHFRVVNGGAVRAETLWARLSRAGQRVAVINVPMTYPPEPVNGFLIAGMDAPRQDRAFTHPPELESELRDRFGGYREGVRARGRIRTSVERFTARYVKELCDVTRLHGEVACYLLERHPIDFLMVVFTAPDRVQHALGHLMADGVSPEDGIGRVYRACDSALGRILERLDDDWTTLVMSDHGACAYHRVFELGTWLEMQGWLRLRPASRSSRLAESLAPARRLLARLTGQIAQGKPRLEGFLDRIVWSETRAFALGAFGSIYINTRDRFPGGIVEPGREYQAICEQIAEKLMSVRDPATREPIVHAVHQAREVYQGPCVHLAPDLLVETTNDYFVRNNLDHEEGRLTYPAGRYRGRSLAHTGRHTSEGILIAAGTPFVPGGDRIGARIIDVTPTVLYLNGLPVPSDMDGRPLLDWLDPGYCKTHPVRRAAPQPADKAARDEVSYTEQDAAAVEARLRDLGYMG
jgi:predicted AlkP superfamily phosphohydrolase/phosphomutase